LSGGFFFFTVWVSMESAPDESRPLEGPSLAELLAKGEELRQRLNATLAEMAALEKAVEARLAEERTRGASGWQDPPAGSAGT